MDEFKKGLVAALKGGQAYDTLEQILSEVPVAKRYSVPDGLEHSAWQILDHMRRTLEDLYSYSTNFDDDYRVLNWPDDYWPTTSGRGDDWEKSLAGLEDAQAKMEVLVAKENLTRPFPWERSHNLLREVILAIEHAAYHAGELVQVTRSISRG